ncbi:GIY-YIG nuclease family protein [Lacipirellula sp.]|uniref:GIY-YIG nuclease family protein n=1 Tax=Lacipirellula sp. TaxID=2691419 RepID=UPI003D133531
MPDSPHDRRMRAIYRQAFPPPWDKEALWHAQRVSRLSEMDIASRIRVNELAERFPHWAISRYSGGSGFIIANALRSYFHEFVHRISKAGFHALPTAFNVVEALFHHDRSMCGFDLLPEREHLLSLNQYFTWYESNGLPRDPALLLDAMPEGFIYSYNFPDASTGYHVTCGESRVIVAGIAMVRHEWELSCFLLTGENPPNPPDEKTVQAAKGDLLPSKPGLFPAAELSVADRYLKEFPGYGRVAVLTRLDLKTKRYEVRYVNVDIGNAYEVFTDDEAIFSNPDFNRTPSYVETQNKALARYNPLFSAASALIYLPFIFVDEMKHVQDTDFPTSLYVDRRKKYVKEAKKALGAEQLAFFRTVRCLTVSARESNGEEQAVIPPELSFEASGYWKSLPPGSIGQTEDGIPIVGRTWVNRKDIWGATSPESFLLSRAASRHEGPDPGVVYVMRSPAHQTDLYKVGLTRHEANLRADQLSSATGVPLPFGVLASWEVGDCAAVERAVHEHLDWCRLSSRREFFATSLSQIVKVIENAARNARAEW